MSGILLDRGYSNLVSINIGTGRHYSFRQVIPLRSIPLRRFYCIGLFIFIFMFYYASTVRVMRQIHSSFRLDFDGLISMIGVRRWIDFNRLYLGNDNKPRWLV
jgi:hypothetical protein